MDVPPLPHLPGLEVRPYQQRIVGRALELFCDKGLRSLLIESPTGSGKTVMGLLTAKALQTAHGLRIGWVALRRNLLTQTAAENRARGIDADVAFISMFDRDPPRPLDLIIVDEAQHDAAASMAHLHNLIQPRFILGLSATPFRADRVKLCFDSVLKDAGIQRLIQDGYLSPYHHYTMSEYTPEAVADLYVREQQRWGKSVLFFHSLDQCRTAQNLLRAQGVACDVVTGSSDRDAQIDAFRAGRLDVLINCVVLAEGFDCPELRTVFCRPSCQGVTVQMGGRVFRRHPDVPVKQIVQCQKTRWPFPRTAAPAQHFVRVGDEWRSLKVNSVIDQVNTSTLRTLAHIKVELPKCLVQQSAGRALRRTRRRTG